MPRRKVFASNREDWLDLRIAAPTRTGIPNFSFGKTRRGSRYSAGRAVDSLCFSGERLHRHLEQQWHVLRHRAAKQRRLSNVKLIAGIELEPVIADDFILIKFNEGIAPMKGNRGESIPIKGDFEKGQTFTIIFSGEPV